MDLTVEEPYEWSPKRNQENSRVKQKRENKILLEMIIWISSFPTNRHGLEGEEIADLVDISVKYRWFTYTS